MYNVKLVILTKNPCQLLVIVDLGKSDNLHAEIHSCWFFFEIFSSLRGK